MSLPSAMIKQLRIASVSDVHCGHKRNDTCEILRALDAAFLQNEYLKDIDLFFIAGDFFDRLLDLKHPALSEIDIWIARFLTQCAKHDVVVRVLEGTPSHDWKQSERFLTISEILEHPADIKYIDTLAIEYIEKLDTTVLYVPDEWDPSTENTLKQVKALIQAKGLSQVDFACMHGAFEYQLPSHVKNVPVHNSAEYLQLVKHLIFIGHIHVFSQYERIIAQGSFDRLSHGEESPKGWVEATLRDDGTQLIMFKQNIRARVYKTISLYHNELQDALLDIDQVVSNEPIDACIRIEAPKAHPIFSNFEHLIKMHPTITWSKKPLDEEEVQEIEITDTIEYTPITITKDNIRGFMVDRLRNKHHDEATVAAVDQLIEEIIAC